MRLEKKTILLAGATGGIGRELTREFYEEGANLVLVARTLANLHSLADALDPVRSKIVATDAADAEAVETLFDQALSTFDQIDVVVIAVGTWDRVSWDTPSAVAVQKHIRHFETMQKASCNLMQVAGQRLAKQGGGLIAHLSSHVVERLKLPGNLTYRAAKTAASAYLLGLAEELVGSGVRVADLRPAIVNTAETRQMMTPDQAKQAVQPKAIAERIIWSLEHEDAQTIHLLDSPVVLD